MTNRVKHHRALSKPIIITIVVLLIVILGGGTFYYFMRPLNVEVILFNAADGSQVSDGYVVMAEYNQTAELRDGKFYLSKVKGDAEVSVTGPGLYSPVRFTIDNRRKIEITLNADFENAIESFVRNLQLRQYRKNYDVMAESEKAKIGVDIFLKDMNAWQDDFLSRGLEIQSIEYRIDTQHLVRRGSLSKTEYNDVTKIVLIWNIVGENRQYSPETTAYFIIEEGQAKWLYDEELLP